jgi:hypothetical protein
MDRTSEETKKMSSNEKNRSNSIESEAATAASAAGRGDAWSWFGLLALLFVLGVLMLLVTWPAAAGAIRGGYDMAIDAIWEYGNDWGYYENDGIAILGRREFTVLSYGDNGLVDDVTLDLDRRINNWQPVQVARGIGPIRLYDLSNGRTSRGTAVGDLYIVHYGGGIVDIEVEYSAMINRGWWQGLWIDGWIDAWK